MMLKNLMLVLVLSRSKEAEAFDIVYSNVHNGITDPGGTVMLTCKTDSYYETCEWRKEVAQAGERPKSCHFEWKRAHDRVRMTQCSKTLVPRLHFVGDYERHECSVVLDKVDSADAGRWTCELESYVFGFASGYVRRKTLEFMVLPPTTADAVSTTATTTAPSTMESSTGTATTETSALVPSTGTTTGTSAVAPNTGTTTEATTIIVTSVVVPSAGTTTTATVIDTMAATTTSTNPSSTRVTATAGQDGDFPTSTPTAATSWTETLAVTTSTLRGVITSTTTPASTSATWPSRDVTNTDSSPAPHSGETSTERGETTWLQRIFQPEDRSLLALIATCSCLAILVLCLLTTFIILRRRRNGKSFTPMISANNSLRSLGDEEANDNSTATLPSDGQLQLRLLENIDMEEARAQETHARSLMMLRQCSTFEE